MDEAADYLGIKPGTLRNLRTHGQGPKAKGRDRTRSGRPLVFELEEIQRYCQRRDLAERLDGVRWMELDMATLRQIAGQVELAQRGSAL